MISLVASRNGDALTTRIDTINANATPAASAVSERRMSLKSTTHSDKPSCMMGPISGEISIAPMTTAAEDCNRPRIAMPHDIMVMNR